MRTLRCPSTPRSGDDSDEGTCTFRWTHLLPIRVHCALHHSAPGEVQPIKHEKRVQFEMRLYEYGHPFSDETAVAIPYLIQQSPTQASGVGKMFCGEGPRDYGPGRCRNVQLWPSRSIFTASTPLTRRPIVKPSSGWGIKTLILRY